MRTIAERLELEKQINAWEKGYIYKCRTKEERINCLDDFLIEASEAITSTKHAILELKRELEWIEEKMQNGEITTGVDSLSYQKLCDDIDEKKEIIKLYKTEAEKARRHLAIIANLKVWRTFDSERLKDHDYLDQAIKIILREYPEIGDKAAFEILNKDYLNAFGKPICSWASHTKARERAYKKKGQTSKKK